MNKYRKMSITALLFTLNTMNSFAGSKMPSAMRFPDETYEEARLRISGPDSENKAIPGSAVNVAVPYASILTQDNLASMPKWSSMSQVNMAFKEVRNKQFINWTSTVTPNGMMRRSSWLYPDDGCFARAELMKINLQSSGYPGVKKMFIFGNLNVTTPNHPSGRINWWFHVVPVLNLNNELIVLDPALESSTPLSFYAWAARMGSVDSMKFAICDEDTYDPENDSCSNALPIGAYTATSHQKFYLNEEWNRTIDLGMDPFSVLGSNPPWNLSTPF